MALRKAVQRIHNEYFSDVSLGGRKSCPNCYEKLNGSPILGWYEYHRIQLRLIMHFCQRCYPDVQRRLLEHSGPCGCTFVLNWKGSWNGQPAWLTLDTDARD
jgi:hypothetical protein